MNNKSQKHRLAVSLTALFAALAAFVNTSQAQTFSSVTNGLVSYYPLDYLTPGDTNSTPDVINRRDLLLSPATTVGNIVASTIPYLNPAAVSNCFNLNQSGGATVLYYNSQGQNLLDGSGDFLPFCNQRGATMNFWIRAAAVGTDTRFMGEADTTGGNANPLWLWGDHSSAPGRAHMLERLQDTSGPGGSTTMADGTFQLPAVAGPTLLMEQGTTYTASNLLDNTWHMFTVTVETNGDTEVYIDGIRDTGNGAQWQNLAGSNATLRTSYVTNFYYTTNDYPAAGVSNPPPRGYVGWALNNIYKSGSTAFGGFKRGGITGGINGRYDDIGFWNRVLTTNEIEFVRTNGLPGIPLNTNLIKINSLTADVGEVGVGNSVTLRWDVTGAKTTPGGIVINNGVGDVTALGAQGATTVPIAANQTYTFTLTANNGVVADKTLSVSVKTLRGVTNDWNLVQRWDGLFSDTSSGFQGNNWITAQGDFAGPKDRWNVVTLPGKNNKVIMPKSSYYAILPVGSSTLGYNTPGAVSVGTIGRQTGTLGLTMPPGRTNTLFCRFSLQEPAPVVGFYSGMDFGFGITDFNIVGPQGYGGPLGPYFAIQRDPGSSFTGGPFNLIAQDYDEASVNATRTYTNNFNYLTAVDPNGLQTNVNYYLWMDVENYNTQAVEPSPGNTNSVNQARFSVWLMKQGDTTRTQLFSRFHGNRDYVNYNPVVDSPTPYLNRVFANIAGPDFVSATPPANQLAYFATNNPMIAVDDIYMSQNGTGANIPKLFDISSVVAGSGSITIKWDSLGSMFQTNTYSVQRKTPIAGSWTTLTNGLPSGGDTTTFVDTAPPTGQAYYRIVWP